MKIHCFTSERHQIIPVQQQQKKMQFMYKVINKLTERRKKKEREYYAGLIMYKKFSRSRLKIEKFRARIIL